jgi:predicted enzyme related to lactoylglutathione lyase
MRLRRLETPTRLANLCFDANDPLRLARFWAGVLEWDIYDETQEEIGVLPTDGTRFILIFLPVPEPKVAKNRLHLDLTSESVEHQAKMVDQCLRLGARHIDIGQGPDAKHVVLEDPEGNEFCVVGPENFVTGVGTIGAIAHDAGDPSLGRFWSEAVGWPVVYDDHPYTAIRAPDGIGPYITFGPPVAAKPAKNRLHLDIAPQADGDQKTEVERLEALGAKRIDIGQGDVPWVVLADPEGNEFCVLTPR